MTVTPKSAPARLRRVGHKGADAVAPGNTTASFDAALEAGVDMIEFDVLPDPRSGELVLAHDLEDAAAREPLALAAALEHLSLPRFAGIELDVDLKGRGYELPVVRALHERGFIERTLISSTHRASLAVVRGVAPGLKLGWSIPRLRRDYRESWYAAGPARLALALAHVIVPRRARAELRSGRCDALMAHEALATPALAAAVREAGGELYVWTVDDRARIEQLRALGVTGVITNDPRLFAEPDGGAAA